MIILWATLFMLSMLLSNAILEDTLRTPFLVFRVLYGILTVCAGGVAVVALAQFVKILFA